MLSNSAYESFFNLYIVQETGHNCGFPRISAAARICLIMLSDSFVMLTMVRFQTFSPSWQDCRIRTKVANRDLEPCRLHVHADVTA